MSILSNYTLRCLKRNRVRTLVTVVGIILSVALFTAVAEGAYSGQQYLVDVAEASVGAYHGMYDEVSDAELAELKAQEGVDRVVTLDAVGWALAGDPTHVYPYLRISSMPEDFTELVTVRLLEGRMPENDHELLISDRANPSTGAELRVGQRLRLTVGRRETLDGLPLGEHNPYLFEEERLVDCQEEIYTIVGMYDRMSSSIESYEMPGTLVLTVGAPSAGTDHKAFFTLRRVGEVYDFLETHDYGSGGVDNRDLLLYSGVSQNGLLMKMLYGLAAVLFGLIFLGSVALIYNSFSISVSERTKQFGLLKSIGATNKQMRRTVLTEALLLCLVGIPLGLLVGCGGIGLTLRFLRPAFDRFIQIDGVEKTSIRLALNAPALGISAGIGLVTALVSAWIPAKRATRLSPIAAIRQSADVKVRAKEVRVSKLTGRLFGFPGLLAAKNFKRSRKQYRSTVVSLFLSIVLFISAFSFADYLRKDVADNVTDYVPDLVVYRTNSRSPATPEEAEALAGLLRSAKHVKDLMWTVSYTEQLRCPASAVSEEAKASALESDGETCYLYPSFIFLPEEAYRALCAEAGVDPETRQAVAYAKARLVTWYEDGSGTYQIASLFRDGVIPLTLDLTVVRPREGMVYVGPEYEPVDDPYGMEDEGGILGYNYVPAEAVDEYSGYSSEDYVLIAPEEATVQTRLVIAGLLEEQPLASGDHALMLYLPLSGAEALWQAAHPYDNPLTAQIFLEAPEHETAKAEVEELLEGQGLSGVYSVYDTRDDNESGQAFLLVLNVFTFGFIILISLIAAANVFNTISTNVALRRREFATLKSVGMGDRAFGRMMRFECLLYGSKALLFGLPVSIGVSWLIWKAVSNAFIAPYRLPWTAMAIAAGSVFLVVFATMLYATGKIRKDNPIDALKQETL